jgi:hypothetical protein
MHDVECNQQKQEKKQTVVVCILYCRVGEGGKSADALRFLSWCPSEIALESGYKVKLLAAKTKQTTTNPPLQSGLVCVCL